LVRLGHTLQLLRLDTSCLSVRSLRENWCYFFFLMFWGEKVLPDSIGCLTTLTTLDVSCNRLQHINPNVYVTECQSEP
jgi:hypothetical protein